MDHLRFGKRELVTDPDRGLLVEDGRGACWRMQRGWRWKAGNVALAGGRWVWPGGCFSPAEGGTGVSLALEGREG